MTIFQNEERKTVSKKGAWYIGGKKKKKKKQKGKRYPIGVIASLAAPVLGAVAKPIKKIFGGRKRHRRKIKRW